jgi:uncharacterized protein (DUF952 family)
MTMLTQDCIACGTGVRVIFLEIHSLISCMERISSSSLSMIFHIAIQSDWDKHATLDYYLPAGFDQEGFIHLSTQEQVSGVLQRYYQGREDLLLLSIDETKLTATLKYEPSTGNELYPHLYGKLNKSAIVKVEALSKVM